MRNRRLIWLVLFILILMGACSDGDPISYSDDIKPLLNKKCLRCHGGIRSLGGFSLLFPEQALAPTESGKLAIVPGKPAASELIARVKHHDPDLVMPQEGTLLTKDEIALLEKWIRQGAEFDKHWSYRPLLPSPPPSVKMNDWVKNDIDRYILDRMSKTGLTPNETADLSTLVRRLSFDITGLPPDVQHLHTLVGNDWAKEQIETIIDDLLASPHYGEHLAALWLDLARYADSNGYEKDMSRSIWRYRDWVIDAFNADMPFDQFTIEQLAGDLLPDPDKEQLIATAFHRNTMTNTEGGTEDEEFRTMSVLDRVNSTFELWQGTTISCVQCHSHPYDPFKHEDYYRLVAYFNNTQDADIDSEYPYLLEHSDSIKARMDERALEIHQLDSRYLGVKSSGDTKEKVRQLVFPRLFGDFADDFQSVLINSGGGFNNSAYNANNQKNKQYYLVFSDIDLDDIDGIRYHYFSRGDDALIEVYLDNLEGEPVLQTKMIEPAKKDWDWLTTSMMPQSGTHDLIFHFVNTSGDFRTGVVDLKEVELLRNNKPLDTKVRSLQDSLLRLYRSGILTPVMKDRTDLLSRQTHVFDRGNYLVKGDEVRAGVPQILNQNNAEVNDRLDFARWLVREDNPLTARVMVNRIWSHIFGEGLVSTPEDFGTQGALPTHPELLDYLAYHFSHDWNWSVKRLVKEIVLSATYQQSSKASPEKLELDPYNEYYSRGNRVRLSAEQIRDQALAISDLLNPKIGGKSVMPPQPDGVWQVVYNSDTWEAKKTEDKYRRGLYTFWKRTTPYPSMTAFDSPSREFCVSKRIRTTTPLQALVTLNDTVYIEAAQALGAFMEKTGKENLQEAIKKGFHKALLVDPDQQTVEVLEKLFYQANAPRPQLVSLRQETIKLDPYTVVANAIMNLDAFLTKS
ncbi:MAG: PSD1 domain-containing protein [Saprospiraceae bacterium]|nr:PSD1 domain-containing protein [Saprospiraceae bacterium]